jgi:cellobiose phosphorylase
MYRIVLENMLGLTRRGPVLNIQPCIPRDWPGFEVDYRFGAALYHLRVSNPHRICSGVQSIDLDGSALDGTGVPLTDDGQEHELRVIMGSPEAARRALARSGTGE